jgi:hypothetical protein
VVMDEDTEHTSKPRRHNSGNAAKRSFKDFIRNDNLRMGKISEDHGEIMQLTDYVLTTSEKVIKRGKIIRNQLIKSQKYIRDLWRRGEESHRPFRKILSKLVRIDENLITRGPFALGKITVSTMQGTL